MAGGFLLIFPLKSTDACAGGKSGLKCPLKSGSTLAYAKNLSISLMYPADLTMLPKVELTDKSSGGNIMIICTKALVEIVG